MRKIFRIGSATFMILLVSALAFSQSNADRKTSVINLGNGTNIAVTTDFSPSDGIGDICGKTLYFSGMSENNTRIFNSDGTGEYVNDCQPGQNKGNFQWGFVLSDSDKSQLKIKTFLDWGWGVKSDNKAAEIMMRFSGGCADGDVEHGIIGVNNGKVVQGMGYGYAEK